MTKNYSLRDPPETRFWARVEIPSDPDGCWEWIGAKIPYGYGEIMINYRNIGTHRFSWELHYGPIPEGMWVCHHCDNPSCVNPKHLFLGTPNDNMQDKVRKGRAKGPPPPLHSGETHPMAKLTWAEVDEIRNLYASGQFTLQDLASQFGVVKTNISSIVRWITWRRDDSPPPSYPGTKKLTETDVSNIRAEYGTGKVLQKQLAKRYGVSSAQISVIVNRKQWADILNQATVPSVKSPH